MNALARLLVVVAFLPAMCLGAEQSPLRATWELPPKCDPFAPPRLQDLKEELRQYWSHYDKDSAGTFLTDWIDRARITGIKVLKTFAKTLSSHREGLLAYYDHRISSGRLEGTNNKIKTMKRQAYGFRDHEFFKLKILAIHEAKYALVG